MNRTHGARIACMAVALASALFGPAFHTSAGAQQRGAKGVPIFEVDAKWPQLPDNMIMGQVSGIAAGADGHIWVVNRPTSHDESELYAAQTPPQASCCVAAPPVLEFDENGKYIRGWGGPGKGYEWPIADRGFDGPRLYGDCCRPENGEHGAFVDYKGNFWTGGNAAKTNQILKFTKDGKFLLQIGHEGRSKGSNDTENLNKPTGFGEYRPTNELFVSDGYVNRRVVVYDLDTGAYKRHWGAYGKKPDDAAPRTRSNQIPGPAQFNTIHGIAVSLDGMVYAADRVNNRVQAFKVDGTFVKEVSSATCLTGAGSAFGVALSGDPQQQFLYVADGCNGRIVILERDTLEKIGQFGRTGRLAGEWYHLHSIATDPKGNIYTGESLGKRAQRFVFKGLSQ